MVKFNGAPHRLYFQVKPVSFHEPDHDEHRALILFVEGGDDDHPTFIDSTEARIAGQDGTIERLQQELEMAHGRLRTMREESEAANEELRAANEELQSINEEYRSTAEELETGKEELQSINEELQTVNSELKSKVDSISQANSDLQNLMAATDFGTLFMDASLRIKRFTPRLADLFSVTPTDTGRPITDFTHQLQYGDLVQDVQKVLEDLAPIEREVPSNDGRWHLVRFRPYRTVDDKIDGVVVTFVDVTARRRMEDALRAKEARLRLLLSELTHRVKNMLAVVQGMVHQAWRSSQSKKDFLDRLDGRLAALAGSNKLLIDSDWVSADLRTLAETELSAYAEEPSRIVISGEPVALPADIATPIGLVLHELATNAIKYGALANDIGRIEIDWKVDGDNTPNLRFRWREIGGPPVKEPSSTGFGSVLIRAGVPKAKVDYRFPSTGVECDIELPLPKGETGLFNPSRRRTV